MRECRDHYFALNYLYERGRNEQYFSSRGSYKSRHAWMQKTRFCSWSVVCQGPKSAIICGRGIYKTISWLTYLLQSVIPPQINGTAFFCAAFLPMLLNLKEPPFIMGHMLPACLQRKPRWNCYKAHACGAVRPGGAPLTVNADSETYLLIAFCISQTPSFAARCNFAFKSLASNF